MNNPKTTPPDPTTGPNICPVCGRKKPKPPKPRKPTPARATHNNAPPLTAEELHLYEALGGRAWLKQKLHNEGKE